MATADVETVNTAADKAKLGAAIALVLAALVAYYLLGQRGALLPWAALLVYAVWAWVAIWLAGHFIHQALARVCLPFAFMLRLLTGTGVKLSTSCIEMLSGKVVQADKAKGQA